MQLNGVKAILVFDGARLSMKGRVEDERHKQRQEAKEKAQELIR